MSYTFISNGPAKDYEKFMLETIENLSKYQVKGLAIVALVEELEEAEAVTGYWHMGPSRKATAAYNIHMDAVDDMIIANIDRYKEAMDELDED